MGEPLIRNVSDTARWVAVYRARESQRPDALFVDPFAERLAGGIGHDIARSGAMSMLAQNGWPIITRTKLIDDMIARSISDGCTRIVNLAAGFDTRPYRLDLPDDLTWFEVDLPEILADKQRALDGQRPRCALERKPVDLADATARRALLDEVVVPGTTLAITEGLLVYLEEPVVKAIVEDLHATGVEWWISDVVSGSIAHGMAKRRKLENAPWKFAPSDGVAYFERLGWRVSDMDNLFTKAAEFRRLPVFMRIFSIFPQPDPRNPGKAMWSGIVRFGREHP